MIQPAELTAVWANGLIRRSRCAAAYQPRARAADFNRNQRSTTINFNSTGESRNKMSIKHTFAKATVVASLLISLTVCAVGGAVSGDQAFAPAPMVETVALFNPMTPDAPESIAIDHQGNKFISMALTGEIRKIAADGAQSTHAVLPNRSISPRTLSRLH